MSFELIQSAIKKGAKIYGSISGGKDSDAMIETLAANNFEIEGLIHADLGEMEWHESIVQCGKCSFKSNVPLHIVKRSDEKGLLEHIRDRKDKTGSHFWPSTAIRYCTSDLKRDPINKFLRNCGHDFIISAEGIRADESPTRSKYPVIQIREKISSTLYKGMTVEEAINSYVPGKRLALTWFPVFNFDISEVWATKYMSEALLEKARQEYKDTCQVPLWWAFHPAYVYGNDRVSCVFCIMGSMNDLKNGAIHRPELLKTLIELEREGDSTFKKGWSLSELIKTGTN